MSTTHDINPAAPIDLAQMVVGLYPGVAAHMLPLAMRQRHDADWVIGMHDAADDRAVHADFWERHPGGDEVLVVIDGDISVTLECNGARSHLRLQPGQALVVPCGTWHRLHVHAPSRLMFITPSVGSEHRRVNPHEDGFEVETEDNGA